jgi:hypothetical protein
MEPSALPPARDREVRKPRTAFSLVDAKPLEPLLEIAGEPSCVPFFVLEHEHADASRFAVANGREMDLPRAGGCLPQRIDDRVELAGRPPAEEGERDVHMLARDDTDVPELLPLPALDLVEDVVGQAQGEEEP